MTRNPLQYGSLVHDVQFELLTELRDDGLLPLRPSGLEQARGRLDTVLDRVAARHADELAPSIARVWEDAIHRIRTDLREWLRLMSEDPAWAPWRFELSFGLGSRIGRDAESHDEAVRLEGGLQLRGSIDLVEQGPAGALRATDYKTGKVRAGPDTVIAGGATLQPVMYALALEKMFPGRKVASGRLHYCTSAGDFTSVEIPLDDAARESAHLVAKTVGDALAEGFLPAAPQEEKTCEWCDYLRVCGPGEARRVGRKPRDRLEPLVRLRARG